MRRRILDRLTYANVMATVAVFIAIGGSAYALTLPRNSVGSKQLRSDSVGRSEIRRGAVTSSAINNGSIRLRDVSRPTRDALRGQVGPAGPQGPPGPTFFAVIDATGIPRSGNATGSFPSGVNGSIIAFSRSVAGCGATATLATVAGVTPPRNAHVTVAPTSDGRILVQTWDANGGAARQPFNLIVAC